MEENEEILAVDTTVDMGKEMKKSFSRAGFSTVAIYGAMAVVSGVLSGVVAGIVMMFVMISEDKGDIFDSFAKGSLMDIFGSAGLFAIMLATVLGTGLGLFVGILLAKKIMGKVTQPIEKRSLTVSQMIFVVLASFGAWGIGAFIGNISGTLHLPVEKINLMGMSGGNMLPLYIYSIIGAPVLEELAFRKVLLDRLHRFGTAPAALVSALLFGLLHGNGGQFFLAFFIGIVFSAVYMNTGKVKYTILLHMMINTFATVPEFIYMATENSMIYTVWSVLAAVITVVGAAYVYIRRKDRILELSWNDDRTLAKNVFGNAGMKLCIIAGLILLGVTDFATILISCISSLNMLPLIDLISTGLAIILVIMIVNKTDDYGDMPENTETEELL